MHGMTDSPREADNLREIRTICWCGSKATMVARLDSSGNILDEGEQVVIGGEDTYVSLCRKHWLRKQLHAQSPSCSAVEKQAAG